MAWQVQKGREMLGKPLIVSVGMPRAGSGWHYNLIHDLVVAGVDRMPVISGVVSGCSQS